MKGMLSSAVVSVEKLAFTPEEAFLALGIGRTLGYRKMREGVIPALKMDGRWIVPRAALERMLDKWPSYSESLSHAGSSVVSPRRRVVSRAAQVEGIEVPR